MAQTVLTSLAAGAVLAGLAAATCVPAKAATQLLDMDGPVGSTVDIGGDGTRIYVAAAATFRVNRTITDAVLGMSILCRSCAGNVWLFSIPPTPNPPARPLEAREAFVGPAGRTPDLDLTQILTMPELLAGTVYTMVLEMTAGNGAWLSSNAATFDETYVSPLGSFVTREARITNIIGYPFQDVATLTAPGGAFLFDISTAEPAPVPLPAGLPLLAGSLAGLALVRRRKRKAG